MNLLLTGAYLYTQEQFNKLRKIGYHIDFIQYEDSQVLKPDKYDVVVCNDLFRNNDINRFSRLKFIQATSSGMERIPLSCAAERNIKVFNAGDTYSVPIAEFAIMRLLEIYKNSMFFYNNQKRGIWKKSRDLYEVSSKKIGILGFGKIGREIAKRLKAFGADIIAINRSRIQSGDVKYVPLEKIDTILPELDVVIVCIAATDQTNKIIDRKRLDSMKHSAVLINISRGEIVEEDAVIDALNHGKFLGCALDVFKREPLGSPGGYRKLCGIQETCLFRRMLRSSRKRYTKGFSMSCTRICRR